MKSFEYVIRDEVGIHARPAGVLAKAAKGFASTITIQANGKSADLRKLMAVMAMGIQTGTQVTVTAEGEDEDAAVEAIRKLFEEQL